MTLAFSEQINNQPTYFPEKIWDGLLKNKLAESFDYMDYNWAHVYQFEKTWDVLFRDPIKPKLHTIREDPSNRWRAGLDIHMVINNRTRNRFQFAPVVKCVSVQEIEIYYEGQDWDTYRVEVDGKLISDSEIEKLAHNDGFDSVEDFFAYFNKDFKGKLIHWTGLRY